MGKIQDLSLEALRAQVEAMQRENAKLTAALTAKPATGNRVPTVRESAKGNGYLVLSIPGCRSYAFAPTDLPLMLDALNASGPLADKARALGTDPAVVSRFAADKASKAAAKASK